MAGEHPRGAYKHHRRVHRLGRLGRFRRGGERRICRRRDYVEGCETSPVGYLEGVGVKEGFRRRGIARKLVLECEQWAREKGCTEFASDCELKNTASLDFHLGVGFREENRIICFKKSL
ncbi:MAG: GNAT family N-acetyltransferase [Clostridiales bacterium]|nr:GNAT family N-acetyltransferase [Clostridiales bacterium]